MFEENLTKYFCTVFHKEANMGYHGNEQITTSNQELITKKFLIQYNVWNVIIMTL